MSQITIADRHSNNKPSKKITLTLEGYSPRYAYIWINDELHLITKSSRSVKIKKVKSII